MSNYGLSVVVLLTITVAFMVAHFVYTLLRYVGTRRPRIRVPGWQRAIHVVMLLGTAIQAGTAFYAVLAHGAMHGQLLFVHSLAAGAVVFTLPWLALFWAAGSRFEGCCGSVKVPQETVRFTRLTRLTFWPLMIAGFLMMGGVLSGMLGLVDASQQEPAMQVHRYTGLAFTCLAMVHAYALSFDRVPLQ